MGRRAAVVGWGAVLLVTLACGSLGNLGNLGNLTGAKAATIDSLWADVPGYPGAAKTDLEMPASVRLAVEAASRAVQGNLPGESGTLTDLQFIAFTTADSAGQVQSFYTSDRMAEDGWPAEEAPGCGAATAAAEQLGTMCVFAKQTDTKNSALFLVATPGDNGGSVIFYIRADGEPPAK